MVLKDVCDITKCSPNVVGGILAKPVSAVVGPEEWVEGGSVVGPSVGYILFPVEGGMAGDGVVGCC